jgi:hypothetical protein
MLIALFITGLLSSYFVNLTRRPLSSKRHVPSKWEAHQPVRLVLAGMIIGAWGINDLRFRYRQFSFAAQTHTDLRGLYNSAMRIGRDHVAATVNTLFLAYAGAALPMLLLFSLSGERYGYLVNLEFVTEEIVRTLVGSLGLILSVPITTMLATLLALYNKRLGGLRRYLGPDNSGAAGHTHS